MFLSSLLRLYALKFSTSKRSSRICVPEGRGGGERRGLLVFVAEAACWTSISAHRPFDGDPLPSKDRGPAGRGGGGAGPDENGQSDVAGRVGRRADN